MSSTQVRLATWSGWCARVLSSYAWWNDRRNDWPVAGGRRERVQQCRDQYLGSQRLGRLATVGHDGMPHVVPVASATTPTLTPSTSAATTSPSARSSATSSGRAWPRWWSTMYSRLGSPAPWRCVARRLRWIVAARPSWRGSTTRSFGSVLAGSCTGALRTASRLVRSADSKTPPPDPQPGAVRRPGRLQSDLGCSGWVPGRSRPVPSDGVDDQASRAARRAS